MHLDKLPAGFPATDSGLELRILWRLFTPDEAETALALGLVPEFTADIARKLGSDEFDVETLCYQMSQKGLIIRYGEGPYKYLAAHFITGIWEYHVNNLDEDMIRDVNGYIPKSWEKRWVKQSTQQLRVVPVSKSIPAEMNVMPYVVRECCFLRAKRPWTGDFPGRGPGNTQSGHRGRPRPLLKIPM